MFYFLYFCHFFYLFLILKKLTIYVHHIDFLPLLQVSRLSTERRGLYEITATCMLSRVWLKSPRNLSHPAVVPALRQIMCLLQSGELCRKINPFAPSTVTDGVSHCRSSIGGAPANLIAGGSNGCVFRGKTCKMADNTGKTISKLCLCHESACKNKIHYRKDEVTPWHPLSDSPYV